MKKKEKFIKICDLSVSKVLLDFINKELLPGTGVSRNHFWKGFNKTVHYLAPKNKKLIEIREKIQKYHGHKLKLVLQLLGNIQAVF